MKKTFSLFTFAIIIALIFVGCPINDSNNNNNGKITSLQSLIDKASAGSIINLSNYNISNYNATVNKTLTINGSDTNYINCKNGTITIGNANGTSISGIKNANITTSSSLGNGSLKIANSSLSTLTINGGGMHTIEIPNVDVNQVTINKEQTLLSENVRLLVDKDTVVQNKLELNTSVLIDSNGDITGDTLFPKGASSIDLKDNVNLAFRKIIDMDTPEGKAKANFNTGDLDKSFYVFVNEGSKLNEAMVKQTANVICGNIDEFYQNSTTPINYEESISGNITFTTTLFKNPFIVTDFNKELNHYYIYDGETTSDLNLSQNYTISNANLFNQAKDLNGNIYFLTNFQNNSAPFNFNLYAFTKIYQEKSLDVGIKTSQLNINNKANNNNLTYSRLDVFDNGNNVLIADVSTMTDVEEEEDDYLSSYLRVYKIDANSEECEANKNIKIVEKCDKDKESSFAQAVAFDIDGNIYVAICKYKYKKNETQNSDDDSLTDITISNIEDNGSYICKYNHDFEKDTSFYVTYKDLGIFTQTFTDSYTTCTETTEEYTIFFGVETFINNVVTGIQDMKIIDNKLVICASNNEIGSLYIENKPMTSKRTDNQKIIFYDLALNKIDEKNSITNDFNGNTLFGPCRIAYADKQHIVIYDNGYYLENYSLSDFTDASAINKNQLISISKDRNQWITNLLDYDIPFPLINDWR